MPYIDINIGGFNLKIDSAKYRDLKDSLDSILVLAALCDYEISYHQNIFVGTMIIRFNKDDNMELSLAIAFYIDDHRAISTIESFDGQGNTLELSHMHNANYLTPIKHLENVIS